MDDDGFLIAAVVTCMSFYMILRKRRRNVRWRNRRWWVRPINQNRLNQGDFNHLFQDLKEDEVLFHRYTRMDAPTFNDLLHMVHPFLTKASPRALPPEQRLSMTLRYLATGDQILTIAMAYRISESTARAIIKEVCQVLVRILSPIYLRQPTEAEWKNITTGFLEQWNFPNIAGAFDGKHVIIQAPPNSGSSFFNYKKTFSVVLLAACDANYKFTLVHVGEMGSNNDAGIFADSSIAQLLRQGQLGLPRGSTELPGSNIRAPCFFIGDEAFPLTTTMMRPYSGHGLSQEKKVFNYRLSRARRTIENAFGILSSRWRIFRKPIALHPEFVDDIILAAVCLHNFLKTRDEALDLPRRLYCPPAYVDFEDEQGLLRRGMWRDRDDQLQDIPNIPQRIAAANAIKLRDTLAAYFLTPQGEVPWQYDYVNRTGNNANGAV